MRNQDTRSNKIPNSKDDLLRAVGRKVLTGALSLAMTASLVPVYPTSAWAGPNDTDGTTAVTPADGEKPGSKSDAQDSQTNPTETKSPAEIPQVLETDINPSGTDETSKQGTEETQSGDSSQEKNGKDTEKEKTSEESPASQGDQPSNQGAVSIGTVQLADAGNAEEAPISVGAVSTEPSAENTPVGPTNNKKLIVPITVAEGFTLNVDKDSEGSSVELKKYGENNQLTSVDTFGLAKDESGSYTVDFGANNAQLNGTYQTVIHAIATKNDAAGETATADFTSADVNLDNVAPSVPTLELEASTDQNPTQGDYTYFISRKLTVSSADSDLASITVTANDDAAGNGATASLWSWDSSSNTDPKTPEGGAPMGDGKYSGVKAIVIDEAGNKTESQPLDDKFVVDGTAPKLISAVVKQGDTAIDTVGSGEDTDGPYLKTPASFVFTINETNFDSSKISVTNKVGAAIDTNKITWTDDDQGNHTGTLPLGATESEDAFKLKVSGTDFAGNKLTPENDVSDETGKFVIDTKVPEVTSVVGPGDDDFLGEGKTPEAAGKLRQKLGDVYYLDTYQGTWKISVKDSYFDEDNSTFTYGKGEPQAGSWAPTVDANGNMVYTATFSVSRDTTGEFQTPSYVLKDRAGNSTSSSDVQKFVLDDSAPTVNIQYQGGTQGAAGYFRRSEGTDENQPTRTATVTARHWNLDLDTNQSSVTVKRTNSSNNSGWTVPFGGSNSDYNARIDFAEDGHYEISAQAADKGGHSANINTQELTIDNTAPTFSAVKYLDKGGNEIHPDKNADGYYYFNQATYVELSVTDRNIDANSINEVDRGSGCTRDGEWTASGPTDDGQVTYTARFKYEEVKDDTDGTSHTPKVTVTDKAGNSVTSTPENLVIDSTAPTIVPSINNVASAKGDGNDNLFYNQQSNLKFVISDKHPIASAVVDDPDNQYDVTAGGDVVGRTAGTITIGLVDGTKSDKDTEFDNRITLTVTDNSGNKRTWSLKPTGQTVAGGTESNADNDSIYREQKIYPKKLIEDLTPPVVSELSGVTAGTFYSSKQNVHVKLNEFNFEYLRKYDPNRALVTVTKQEGNAGRKKTTTTVPVSAFTGSGSDWETTIPFETDGHYTVTANPTDYAGNDAKQVSIGEFTIDQTAPRMSVTWVNNQVFNGKYYKDDRTATITVIEHNFDPTLFTVEPTTSTPNTSSWDVSGWQGDSNSDIHTYTVHFSSDGTYGLNVSGKDKAGNLVVSDDDKTTVVKDGKFSADEFVIDETAPVISEPEFLDQNKQPIDLSKIASHGVSPNVPFFAKPTYVKLTITDRNLDTTASGAPVVAPANGNVDGLPAVKDWEVSEGDDGNKVYTAYFLYDELQGEFAGNSSATPTLTAVDLATNSMPNTAKAFYVDRTAPTVEQVSVNREPSAKGDGEDYQFYNDLLTNMTFKFSDVYSLASAVLDDPDGLYEIKPGTNVGGKSSGEITIQLKDGVDAAPTDSEFQRNIRLILTDFAGNQRIWTMDRTGSVVDDQQSSTDNIPVDGNHPVSLIEDTTPPAITLGGVDAGTYYNSDQSVHAAINEFNFGYLQRFAGDRTIITVTKQEGDAGRAESSWKIPASAFVGGGSDWATDLPFNSDGHYTVRAQFKDYANNDSNEATIGEFTIDKTAPVMTVTWDNNDVRNGKYYKAGRTATIAVVEHNFDPSLFEIKTNGAIGGWSDSGDTHTCTVSFTTDGTYDLTVSGKDKANNEATPFTEPQFVVDLTAPKITFGGEAQRLGVGDDSSYDGTLEDVNAYNGIVAPQIDFADEANFDPSGENYKLVGGKNGDVTASFGASAADSGNSRVVQFADFGKLSADQAGEDASVPYDVNADDVYVLTADMTDLAGNTAQGTITFSVNRFGSNYLITADDAGNDVQLTDATLLTEAPTITVREINVSGAESEAEHSVLKEYANATTNIERDDSGDRGYSLETPDAASAENGYGWAEYVYTIKKGNFGEGSDSDTGDGGQGTYRVNVTTNDLASNANTTAGYWSSDIERAVAEKKQGAASFTLDEVGPSISNVDVPTFMKVSGDYQGSFTVDDNITNGNDVEVTVDGEPVEVYGPNDGKGTFTFTIPAKSFKSRNIDIRVTDYAGRQAEVTRGSFYVTNLIVEILIVLAAAGAVGGVIFYRRKKGGNKKAATSAKHQSK